MAAPCAELLPFTRGKATMSAIVEVEELGRRIRKLRTELRLTLKQVEVASGLSATHLSEIERGRTSPTIGALVRIARALKRDASYFIESEERDAIAHVKGSAGTATLPGGASADVLTPGIPGSRVFAYQVRIGGEQAGGIRLEAGAHDGHAIYFVKKGSVRARFGDADATLATGDAAQATLAIPHDVRAVGGPAEVLLLCTRSMTEES
jgi:transcriptional regulator with XRE-family HTH domain